jgi:hypothetical protein
LSEYCYPKEITEDNIESTLKRAKDIKGKTTASFILTGFVFSIIAVFLLFGFFFLDAYIINVLNPTSIFQGLLLFVVFLMLFGEFLVLILFDFVEKIINRVIKLEFRESVLASCILIANCLYKNERAKAKNEIEGFMAALLGLKRTTGKAYSREISFLSDGRKQIRRMLSFSEGSIPELFLCFGTNIYNNDDPMAYLLLKGLVKKTEEYGKIEGFFKQIENYVKSYKGIIALIMSVATIIIGLLGKGVLA